MVSRLIVIHSDQRISEAVRYGFEREGSDVVAARLEGFGAALSAGAPELVVAGGESEGEALSIIEGIRGGLVDSESEIPILYLGNAITRDKAIDAGAQEFLEAPAYLRDVVTLGRLLASPGPAVGGAIGRLEDYVGLFYVVRALSAAKRTGVLTLVRGLRRGELRFYEGEVTSAQLGVLHGLAALHQLLLWTEARFELRDEIVVRRRQIPLSPDEVLADAERFLSEVRNAADGLSPATLFEQVPDALRAAELPAQVSAVAGLFDSNRTLADVIEDSPFRVLDTLRVSRRLLDTGLIKAAAEQKRRSGAHAALAIEEWLIGDPARVIDAPTARRDSEPVGPAPGEPASPPKSKASKKRRKRKKNKKKQRAQTQQGMAVKPEPVRAKTAQETDWNAILPSAVPTGDVGLSPVVPSSMASGEIDVSAVAERLASNPSPSVTVQVDMSEEPDASDDEASAGGERAASVSDGAVRERLEEVANTGQRANIFPAESVPESPGARESVEAEAAAAAADADARAAEEVAMREAQAIARKVMKDAAAVEPATASKDEPEPDDADTAGTDAGAQSETQAALAAVFDAAAAGTESASAEAAAAASAEAADAASADVASADASDAESDSASADASDADSAGADASDADSADASDAVGDSAGADAADAASADAADAESDSASADAADADSASADASDDAEGADASASDAEAAAVGADEAEDERLDDDAVGEWEDGAVAGRMHGGTSGEIAIPDRVALPDASSAAPSVVIAEDLSSPAIHIAEFAAVTEDAARLADAMEHAAFEFPTSDQAQDVSGRADLGRKSEVIADDASHFTDDEEAFFSAGKKLEKVKPPPFESFHDLDDDYREKTFWERLMSRPDEK